MLTHVGLRSLGVRLVLLISDRQDLQQQLTETAQQFLGEEVAVRCTGSAHLLEVTAQLEEHSLEKVVLSCTLQSFPGVTMQLSDELRAATLVIADEAHRSHADKALSEALAWFTKSAGHSIFFTGTASDRCLRLFGEQRDQNGTNVFEPFHTVTEEDVPIIFPLGKIRRECVEISPDANLLDKAAELGIKRSVISALQSDLSTCRSKRTLSIKGAYFLEKFAVEKAKITAFRPQLMIVTRSRRAVMDMADVVRNHLKGPLGAEIFGDSAAAMTVYGAWSGKLREAAAGEDPSAGDGGDVDELAHNRQHNSKLMEEEEAPHREADVLIACDRYETGYDNDRICFIAVDKQMGSQEKLVQVYSRVNRKRDNKPVPLIVDVANHFKTIESAIAAYSIPRRCLCDNSADAASRLSSELEQLMGDMDTDDAETALASWAPEQRMKLAELLALYLRRRREGVQQSMAAGLLAVSRADAAWQALERNHKPEVEAMRNNEKLKVLAEKAASRTCHLTVTSFVDSPLAPAGCQTPLKLAMDAAGDGQQGDLITPPKDVKKSGPPKEGQKSELELEKLTEALDELPDGPGPLRGRSARLDEDIASVLKSPGGGNLSTFNRLDRIVKACKENPTDPLLQPAGLQALLHMVLNGDSTEMRKAWDGVQALASVSTRAFDLVKACKHLTQLHSAKGRCLAALKPPELGALKSLVASLKMWRQAADKHEELSTRLAETKQSLAELKDQLVEKDDVSSTSSSDDNWVRRGRTKRERKQAAVLKRRQSCQEFKKNKTDRKGKMDALSNQVKKLERERSEVCNDLAVAERFALEPVLWRLPELMAAGRPRAQRQLVAEAWEAAGSLPKPAFRQFGLLGAAAGHIGATAKTRCNAGAKKMASIAQDQHKLVELDERYMKIAEQAGVTEDLISLTEAAKATKATIDALRLFSHGLCDKASERCALFDRCMAKVSPHRAAKVGDISAGTVVTAGEDIVCQIDDTKLLPQGQRGVVIHLSNKLAAAIEYQGWVLWVQRDRLHQLIVPAGAEDMQAAAFEAMRAELAAAAAPRRKRPRASASE